MKLSDLRTGDVITYANGRQGMFIRLNEDEFIILVTNKETGAIYDGHMNHCAFDDDLKNSTRPGFISSYDWNVIKVQRYTGDKIYHLKPLYWDKLPVIWERPSEEEPIEMTMTQIKEALGHPVKIIAEA